MKPSNAPKYWWVIFMVCLIYVFMVRPLLGGGG